VRAAFARRLSQALHAAGLALAPRRSGRGRRAAHGFAEAAVHSARNDRTCRTRTPPDEANNFACAVVLRRAAEVLPKPRYAIRAQPRHTGPQLASHGWRVQTPQGRIKPVRLSPADGAGQARGRCEVRATRPGARQAMDGAQTSAASAGRQARCCRSSTQMKHMDVRLSA